MKHSSDSSSAVSPSALSAKYPRALPAVLILLTSLILSLTCIPAPFTIDEDNYLVTVLAARTGDVTLTQTEGLPPSKELRYFCPSAHSVEVDSTPVVSLVPPLYAFLALPFSIGGWLGLVFLNTLAFSLLLYFFQRHAATVSDSPAAVWIGVVALALGAPLFEYAQGLWPQMLSIFLVFAGYLLVAKTLDQTGKRAWAMSLSAGFIVATATGLRYQNVVFIAALGACMFLFSSRDRWRKSLALGLGAAIPLTLSSVINHIRLDSWNPISKSANYIPSVLPTKTASADFIQTRLIDTLAMLWSRVIDFRARPHTRVIDAHSYIQHDPDTGAYIINSSVKKALLQSSPWLALCLVFLLLAWWGKGLEAKARRELKMISLCVGTLILAIAWAGPNRTDGLCFNQRYLLEVFPFFALALVFFLDRHRLPWRQVLAGGVVVCLPMLAWFPEASRHATFFMATPLVLAGLTLAAWPAVRLKARVQPLAILLGACIGWGFSAHMVDDVANSRFLREYHLAIADTLDPVIPDHSALFAWQGNKVPLGKLQLDRDVVIVDPIADNAVDSHMLAQALRKQGRRNFILLLSMPDEVVAYIVRDRPTRIILEDAENKPFLIEIL